MKTILIIFLIVAVFFTILVFWNKSRKTAGNNNPSFISNAEQHQKNQEQNQGNAKQNQEPVKKEQTLDNGLKIEILREGKGEEAKNGDSVSVNYVGTLENGTKFDSSLDRGTPFTFNLGVGQVIKGWDLGVLGMKVGEKRRLIIPPDLAYGDRSVGAIPKNSTLIFDIELLSINK